MDAWAGPQRPNLFAAGPALAPVLAMLHAESFRAPTWDEASFAAQLRLPNVFALTDGQAGLVLARVAADESEILTLSVMPACRRRGLGGALLDGAMDEAARRGAARMLLEVSVGNPPALALYQSRGFRVLGERRGYYEDGGDAWVMERRLSLAPSPAPSREGRGIGWGDGPEKPNP